MSINNDNFTARAVEIVSKMSLTEKISQLRHHSKALPKHGIKEYNWWNECLHGVARAGLATVFPQAIAMAATFSDDVLYKVADIISTEARAKHHEFDRNGSRKIYQGLTFWSPNLNIYRDPRWGRGQETYGEDPVLTASLGNAFIKGLQGNDDKYLKVSACAKHFAVHSGPESERHSIDVNVCKKDLRETYLYAFKSAVVNAKVESVMSAYNMVNGESCCASKTLIQDILRDEWGFSGHVVSDCGGVFDVLLKHKVTRNPLKAVALAINNGLDLECGAFFSILPVAVACGYVSEAVVDKAICRLITTKLKLGMFDNDCVYNTISYSENASKKNEDYAIEVARKCIVMLKNDCCLPLAENKYKVGLVGYNATNELAYLGNYFGTPSSFINMADDLKNRLGDNLIYRQAIGLTDYIKGKGAEKYKNALEDTKDCEYVIVATGLDSTLEGEAGDAGAGAAGIVGEQGDRQSISLPSIQKKLIRDLFDRGKKVIIVNFSGGCVSFEGVEDKVSAILQAWYIGAKGGVAIGDILFGKACPSGRLPLTFYKNDLDLGDFHDYSIANKTYRYFGGDVAYPFGFGMSYNQYKYSNLNINLAHDEISVKFDIECLGEFDSDEVAQVYLKYLDGDKSQPNIKLIAAKRVAIKSMGKINLELVLQKNLLMAYNDNGDEFLPDGRFEISVGGGMPKYAECVSKIITNEQIIRGNE